MSWRASVLLISIVAVSAVGCHGHAGRGSIPTDPIRDEHDPEAELTYSEGAVPATPDGDAEASVTESETTIEIEVDEDAASTAETPDADDSADVDVDVTGDDDGDDQDDSLEEAAPSAP